VISSTPVPCNPGLPTEFEYFGGWGTTKVNEKENSLVKAGNCQKKKKKKKQKKKKKKNKLKN